MEQSFFSRLISRLRTADVVSILFFNALSITALLFAGRFSRTELFGILLTNTVLTALATLFSYYGGVRKNVWWSSFHRWYIVPVILTVFKVIDVMVKRINPNDIDGVLITIDRWMFFGNDPTKLLARFATPLLTEYLQIAYMSFYFLMIALAIELVITRREKEFRTFLFAISLGFYLSYIGYLLFPAVGPRFTLHEFSSIDRELPGIVVTPALRSFLNSAESMPDGTRNPREEAQRDCFPSGHTEMTLIVMILAARFRARSRYVLHILGASLIIATVYLRYHYVIDVIGGAVFVWITFRTMKPIASWWARIQHVVQ